LAAPREHFSTGKRLTKDTLDLETALGRPVKRDSQELLSKKTFKTAIKEAKKKSQEAKRQKEYRRKSKAKIAADRRRPDTLTTTRYTISKQLPEGTPLKQEPSEEYSRVTGNLLKVEPSATRSLVQVKEENPRSSFDVSQNTPVVDKPGETPRAIQIKKEATQQFFIPVQVPASTEIEEDDDSDEGEHSPLFQTKEETPYPFVVPARIPSSFQIPVENHFEFYTREETPSFLSGIEQSSSSVEETSPPIIPIEVEDQIIEDTPPLIYIKEEPQSPFTTLEQTPPIVQIEDTPCVVNPPEGTLFAPRDPPRIVNRMNENLSLYESCKLLGNRLSKFSGNEDKTFEEFLEEYAELVSNLQIPLAHAKSLLPLYLTGGAKLKYQTLKDFEKTSWQAMVTALATKFKNQAMLSNIRDELHNMRQGKDSVADFAKKIVAKTKIAFQGEDKTIPAKLAIDFFIKGLRPEIKKAIRRLPDAPDLETAIANAEKEQRILEQEHREETDILHSINALVLDDKVDKLQKKVNNLQQRNRPKNSKFRQQSRPQLVVATRPIPRMNRRFGPPPRQFFQNRRGGPNNRRFFTNPFRSFGGFRNFNPPFRFNNRTFNRPTPAPRPIYRPMYPQIQGPSNFRLPSAAQNVNFLCILAIIGICLTPLVGADHFQICGSSPVPNVLTLPKLIQCGITDDEPLIETKVKLYAENSRPLQLSAHKCYRDLIKVSLFNFLYIRTTRTIVGRQRVSITPEECRAAKATGTIRGHNLTEISYGLKATSEIEDENISWPLWGTNLYLRSIYSMEEGDIASFDGEDVLSSLGSLTNCSLVDGQCLTPYETVIWEPIQIKPFCRFNLIGEYDALVSLGYILLPEHELTFEFSQDYLLYSKLLRYCDIQNNYLTTSNHLVSFPNIPANLIIQDYLLQTTNVNRQKREVHYVVDRDNRQSQFEVIPILPSPFIERLFGTKELVNIPVFETQPIREPVLLQEIKRWNVTNQDFFRRTKLYAAENTRISVLRTIRYGEYRSYQIEFLRSIKSKRPLNYAEFTTLQDLESGISDIFDQYLAREFGALSFELSRDAAQLAAKSIPFFQEEDLTGLTAATRKHFTHPQTNPIEYTTQAITTPYDEYKGKLQQQYSLPEKSNSEPTYMFNTQNIRRSFRNICIRQYLSNQKLHELSRADPTWAARTLLDTSDVVATLVNNQLLVTKCRSVEPTQVFPNHQVNDTCYNLLPVLLEDQLWFAIPGTGDLVETATETTCPYPESPLSEQAQQLLPPNILNNINAKPFIFNAPPIYHHIAQNFAPTIRFQIQHLQQEYMALQSKLHKRGIIEDAIMKIKSAGNSVGESLSSLYSKTTEKLSEGVESIRWSIIYLVLWITIPTLVLIIIISLCVCGVKMYFLKTTSDTAISTAFRVGRVLLGKKKTRRRREQINVLVREMQPTAPEDTLFIPRVYSVSFAANTTRNSLPYVNIAINEILTPALVDSGATISYMKLSTLQSLGPDIGAKNEITKAQAANGTTISLIATVDLPVRIGNHLVPHHFLVASDDQCPAPVLLGSDFIRKLNEFGLKVTMDLYNHTLTIGDDVHSMIQVNGISLKEPLPYDVRLAETVILPKRSSTIIPAYIDGYFSPQPFDFIIEDNKRDIDLLYVVGRSLIKPDHNGMCMINILNPCYTNIQLYARMKVAHATPISSPQEQIFAVQPTPYIPPEADWEQRMPQFPTPTPTFYDISNEIDLSKSMLSEFHKDILRDIVRYHSNAFVGPDGHLGHYNGPIKHRIDLIENATLPTRKIYRVPLEKRNEIERQINQMLNDNIIQESTSPYCAPIVLVRKRDVNSWRFTIDYRGLNAITKPQQSILPNIQDIIDLCANKRLYSSLDFQQGFHQIPLEETHCERTAFACFLGAFEYIRMPMGLKGAPATFQRIMDDFKKHIRARVFIYIDDLIITSETPEDHLDDIDEVLTKIEQIGMKLKASKCEFAREKIKFLGFILSKQGIQPDPEKTLAIDKYPTPTNITEIKAFLGMCSFFRRFVHNFALIASPLTALTKKDVPFVWTKECDKAMSHLKEALTNAPILVAPKLGAPFIIETDSSGKAVAGVLRQQQGDDLKIIAYASRTLNIHESRYPAIELEALGVVFAVQKFRPYIDGAKCTVITDHAPLKALLHRNDLTGRLAKYQIILQEFDITIIYRAGKSNILCDTLSRHPPHINFTTTNDDNSTRNTPHLLNINRIKDEQNKCSWITSYKEAIENGEPLQELNEYIVVNDILYKLPLDIHQDPQIVLPENSKVKDTLVKQVHESRFGIAHLGIKKTRAAVAKIAIWNNMSKDISDLVKLCPTCQRRKDPSAYRANEPLDRFETPSRPFQRTHSDIVGPLPLTLKGNKFVIVFVDAFSKFIVVEPIPDQKATTITDVFINRFISRFGPPENLITDQGTNFMSDIFCNTLKTLNIAHRTSTPYHHESNGQVERANKTIEELIALSTIQKEDQWDDVIQLMAHAYNSAENATTNYSPYFVLHGREPNNAFRLALQLPSRTFINEEDYVGQLTSTLQNIWKDVHQNIRASQETQKHHYDLRKHVAPTNFEIGQQVLIRKDVGSKIAPKFDGPFPIVDVDRPNVTVQDGRRLRTVHVNRLKPYNSLQADDDSN
ncbi:integrase core domain protein, partial [Oesophagostomum dentatum]